MKIKIRTKEGEFVAKFSNVIKVIGKSLTRDWDNGIEVTETPIIEWHGYEVIKQVSDEEEITFPVQERPPVVEQWKFQIFNLKDNNGE